MGQFFTWASTLGYLSSLLPRFKKRKPTRIALHQTRLLIGIRGSCIRAKPGLSTCYISVFISSLIVFRAKDIWYSSLISSLSTIFPSFTFLKLMLLNNASVSIGEYTLKASTQGPLHMPAGLQILVFKNLQHNLKSILNPCNLSNCSFGLQCMFDYKDVQKAWKNVPSKRDCSKR